MEGIKSRQIKWHPKTNKLCQIPNEGLEYALVSDEYEQIHQLAWCKDFMQDAIHGYLNKSYTKIYGFTYDPQKDPPVSLKRTRMIVTNWKDKDLEGKVINGVLPLLHEVETKLKMSKTVIEKCSKIPPRYAKSGVWLFDSSKRWSKSPPMISLFTLLIRIGLVRNPNDKLEEHLRKIKSGEVKSYFSIEREQDKYQVKRAEKGIKRLFEHGDRKIFHQNIKLNYPPINNNMNYENRVTIYTIHDDCGIGSFSEKFTEQLFPYWHRLKGAKK